MSPTTIASVAAVVLALGSAVLWGIADFAGGALTRRLPLLTVTTLSQAAGFLGLVIVLAASGGRVDSRAFALGLVAGVGGAIGLAAFYKALAVGTMSVVSPVVACGAVVPLTLAVATGERPSALALAGAGVALVGAVMASAEEHRAEEGRSRVALPLAGTAAIALGGFVYFLGLAGQDGETLPALAGARTSSVTLLVCVALAVRAPFRLDARTGIAVAAVGLVDLAANGAFVLASQHGYLAIVSVLGSLYPVTTVLLAHVVLGERLVGVQRAGVAMALAGVALVSTG